MPSKVDTVSQAREARNEAELVRLNGSGTNRTLARELLRMQATASAAQRAVAQSMARSTRADSKATSSAASPELARMLAVNRTTDARLRRIVRQFGWPTVHLVGLRAAAAAEGLLMGLSDRRLDEQMLPELERLAEHKRIPRPNVAAIEDAVLVAHGRKQLYGTILELRHGKPVAPDVQDPSHLEQRREAYGLERNLLQHMTAEMKAAAAPCRGVQIPAYHS